MMTTTRVLRGSITHSLYSGSLTLVRVSEAALYPGMERRAKLYGALCNVSPSTSLVDYGNSRVYATILEEYRRRNQEPKEVSFRLIGDGQCAIL